MAEAILGISAYYHDSAAALVVDGEIVAAAQEERFSRTKHDASFPLQAAKYVIEESGLMADEIKTVVFYDKPYLKFERLLETYHAFVPKGLPSFLRAIPIWIKEKLFMKRMLRQELEKLGIHKAKLLFPEHHLSHAASAFYPSPYEEAAILTIDGVGEWATATIGHGKGNQISVLKELSFPHSLGLLYSAFTYYIGFKVNNGEYKLMGLAPYGQSGAEQTLGFKQKIKEELIDMREDGSILLNMKYFSFATAMHMTHNKRWEALFGIPPRLQEAPLEQSHMNMALAIQEVTEEVVLKLAKTAKELTSSNQLVMAGGVALNCVANGKLVRQKIFDQIWIQPAAGDAGGALGAALAAWHLGNAKDRNPEKPDSMQASYLGPSFSDIEMQRLIRKHKLQPTKLEKFDVLCETVAQYIAEGKVVGWFQGRMEFGPRALGNRSILGDPRNPEMQRKLNLKIKNRESFRPFAPAVLADDVSGFFELEAPSPYMLLVCPVKKERRKPEPSDYLELDMLDRLHHERSDIPAITHVDYSARIQTVTLNSNPRFYQLLQAFKDLTSYGMFINTSFNVRGEPIVCSPEDAYNCFMKTEMDILVIENYIFRKEK